VLLNILIVNDRIDLCEGGICQSTGNDDKDEKPLVIAISSEHKILRDIKFILGEKYKGVYVKNIVDAKSIWQRNQPKGSRDDSLFYLSFATSSNMW